MSSYGCTPFKHYVGNVGIGIKAACMPQTSLNRVVSLGKEL